MRTVYKYDSHNIFFHLNANLKKSITTNDRPALEKKIRHIWIKHHEAPQGIFICDFQNSSSDTGIVLKLTKQQIGSLEVCVEREITELQSKYHETVKYVEQIPVVIQSSLVSGKSYSLILIATFPNDHRSLKAILEKLD